MELRLSLRGSLYWQNVVGAASTSFADEAFLSDCSIEKVYCLVVGDGGDCANVAIPLQTVNRKASSENCRRHSLEAESCESFFDGLLQFCGLGELCVQFADESRHLFGKRFAVVFD